MPEIEHRTSYFSNHTLIQAELLLLFGAIDFQPTGALKFLVFRWIHFCFRTILNASKRSFN